VAARLFPLFPPGISLGEDYQSLDKIPKVTCPVLIIHGDRDEIVPFAMAERLFEAAKEPKYFFRVEGAQHNDTFIVGGERYFEIFAGFALKARI
jgi:hypothetical protein